MRVFLRYALRETGTNLWRNRIMTLAAVLTVAVSLSLVGAALLIKQSASQASAIWERETRVTVWMKPDASAAQISNITGQLAALPYVHGTCQYRDKAQNYAQAKLLTPANEFTYLHQSDMPTSFICVPEVPADVSIIKSTFTSEPGVYQVTGPYKEIKQEEKAIRVVQIVFLVLALVLLVSAVVLILNTIRLAIFARRREVTVMKLVGATNWFIRIPYITEGFMQGLLGSVVAALAVTALHVWYPLGQEFQLSTQDLIGTNIVVIVLGVAIGSLGSAFAIRRFLDV
jgi:cell division transport system permease protein